MSEFLSAILDSFPPALQPPDPLVQFFAWQCERNLADKSEYDGSWYARLDPSQIDLSMCTSPIDKRYSQAWTGSDNRSVYDRLAAFCQTGGDGSYAALWLDDHGATKIVHLGSGSGSTMVGVLVDDPIDFLRLLAIGYDELCWPQNHNQTPKEVFERYASEDDQYRQPPQPTELRNWVEESFGVAIPQKASAIIDRLPDMDDDKSTDPFWLWDHSLPKWQL